MSTNQCNRSWTHYIGTLRGTWTDHMVEDIQEILIE